jgi:hypothetical protein
MDGSVYPVLCILRYAFELARDVHNSTGRTKSSGLPTSALSANRTHRKRTYNGKSTNVQESFVLNPKMAVPVPEVNQNVVAKSPANFV